MATANNSRSSRRREMDFMKLMSSKTCRVFPTDSVSEFWVGLHGPRDTPYEDGVWAVHVLLPAEYPFKSPSIGFSNRIFHPNVDEASGSVCLDVINQTWTPMYELYNIFEVFLPQLLRYPNPSDPLNPYAAAMMSRDPISYVTFVQEHVATHATIGCALQSIPSQYRGDDVTDFNSARGESAAGDSASSSERSAPLPTSRAASSPCETNGRDASGGSIGVSADGSAPRGKGLSGVSSASPSSCRAFPPPADSPATSRGLTDTPPSPMTATEDEDYLPDEIEI